jgi:hypothetical protein
LEQTRKEISGIRLWAPLIPYVTIGTGLLILHNVWIAIVSYHLCMGAILLLTKSKFPSKPVPKTRNYKILVVAAFLGGAGGLLLYLLWPLLGIPRTINLYFQQIGLDQAVWPYFIAYFVLINPWLEENYWRGYLGSYSRRITLNDVLFSGYHLIVLAGKINTIWLISVFVILILGSWFWRQANGWSHGLAPSIISHVVADASIIGIIYFMT